MLLIWLSGTDVGNIRLGLLGSKCEKSVFYERLKRASLLKTLQIAQKEAHLLGSEQIVGRIGDCKENTNKVLGMNEKKT